MSLFKGFSKIDDSVHIFFVQMAFINIQFNIANVATHWVLFIAFEWCIYVTCYKKYSITAICLCIIHGQVNALLPRVDVNAHIYLDMPLQFAESKSERRLIIYRSHPLRHKGNITPLIPFEPSRIVWYKHMSGLFVTWTGKCVIHFLF